MKRLAILATVALLGCGSSEGSRDRNPVASAPPPTASASGAPTVDVSRCYCGTEPGCPPCSTTSASPSSTAGPAAASGVFPPPNFSAPVELTAKSGDGTWTPLSVYGAGADGSPLVTTLVHPHKNRKFVVTQIVAIDTTRVSMNFVVGPEEPDGSTFPAQKRTGLVPDSVRDKLIAVTNGGFKKRHGGHGLGVGGEVVLEAKPDSCTFARTKTGQYVIGTHSKIEANLGEFDYFRQTPPCIVEDGVKNPELLDDWKIKKWGSDENGKKEIRRSAIGLGKDGRTLYFAIADYSTAEWLADALITAGITVAAELDINYSYTRFIVYERQGGELVATSPLLTELKAPRNEYIKSPSPRDFFYLKWER
ncbi:MAG: phosphodiester glycosidase family protein [Polyangiaceae bacterium]